MQECEVSDFEIVIDGVLHLLKIELISLTFSSDCWKLSSKEKHEIAGHMKTLGTKLFKEKSFKLAAQKYGLTLKLLHADNCRVDPLPEHTSQVNSVRMNLALCFMKLAAPEPVIFHCTSIVESLKGDANSDQLLKCLNRRAWAYSQLNEFEKAQADLNEVLKIEEENFDAIKLTRTLASKIKKADAEMSNNLKKLFIH